MARNLIVLRCGSESLHWQWLSEPERNWDFILCPYEDIDARGIESHLVVGQKWSGLHRFLRDDVRWRDYDYICLPDDDIEATATTWNIFFDRCAALKAQLAAPALTPDSYFSHPITLQNANFLARSTSFVEVMIPCFSREFLEIALPTFAMSRSGPGGGLDFLWAAMLSYQNLWFIDETPVRHGRPVGLGRGKVLASLLEYDIARIQGFGVSWSMYHTGGITSDGHRLTAADLEFDKRLRRGYQYLEARIPERWPDNLFERSRAPGATDAEVMKRIKLSLAHLAAPDRTLSRGRPCRVSSVSEWSWSDDPSLEATGGNDGLLNGQCGFHTDNEMNPWWQVDLGAPCTVTSIVIYNRLDQKERCVELDILTSLDNQTWTPVFAKRDGHVFGGLEGSPLTVQFVPNFRGRFVRVQLCGQGFLHLDQVEIFGTSAAAEEPGKEVEQSSQGTPKATSFLKDPYDIDELASLAAGISSSEYAARNMASATRFATAALLRQFAAQRAPRSGLILDCGVYSGESLNRLADILPDRRIFGFSQATFQRTRLPTARPNVELMVGGFDDTLPLFAKAHSTESLALLHIDCDRYAATKTILSLMADRIVAGTILVFDEYFNHPNWAAHEYKAFQEFVSDRQITYEYIGLVPSHQQVALRITSVAFESRRQ